MDERTAIHCRDLAFTYESSTDAVLRGINIEVPRGEFHIIAGPSGAGKSTFCRTLNNIIPLFFAGAFSGTRWIAGEWIEKQSIASIARKVGMVFQDFEQQLFSTSTALELSFGMENFGVPPDEMKHLIAEMVKKFGIEHLIGREPLSLSGGEKQKLAIASVMVYRPQILVLDEPTTDLDPESREFVLNAIPALKDWIETVLLIDHETEQFHSADKIHLLRDGVIQASGSPREILLNSALLEQNALAPVDMARVQEVIGILPAITSPAELASSLSSYSLEPIDVPARTSSAPIVAIDGLTHRYPARSEPALQDVSMEIREGEFAGIIGRNGSGKSTLLRHFNGLQSPQQGVVRILGKDLREWNRKELAQTVGLVFQNPDHQIFESTVRREIEFGPRTFGMNENELKRNSDRALETMDLSSVAEQDPFQLSKGARQRVAVASIISVNPKILILDEPTTGLDYKQQRHLMDLLRELNRSGATVVVVTHALWLIGEYCSYAFLLSDGRKVAEGHPREMMFSSDALRLPPLVDLSKRMGGNAFTVDEFARHLRRR